MASPSEYHGIVVVDKPAGMTSHDVVHVARKLFRTKRVGHTGTLDPDATGVILLCLGNATRLAEYLSAAQKAYRAEVVFGVETTTQDASGEILAEQNAAHLTRESILSLLPDFRGTIKQIPPMVSALHHQGRRLYELAREGITVEREAREIEIESLELSDFTPGTHPVATLEVTCSTGTYIRTLAADLGAAAGTGGMMRALRRIWVGESAVNAFTLEEAHTLEALQARGAAGTLAEIVLPLAFALRDWPRVTLNEEQGKRIRKGQWIALAETDGQYAPDTKVALLDETGTVVAVGQVRQERLQPIKVLNTS
jgi:tRNA pseudouridine55 synthase